MLDYPFKSVLALPAVKHIDTSFPFLVTNLIKTKNKFYGQERQGQATCYLPLDNVRCLNILSLARQQKGKVKILKNDILNHFINAVFTSRWYQ